jgi:methylated-DNA-[protein]-cysteine S-methyltransferase
MAYFESYDSPIGRLNLASDGEHLCGLWIEGQKYYQDKLELRLGIKNVDTKEGGRMKNARVAALEETRCWLDVYFSGKEPPAIPSVFPRGTAFQEEVWAELLAIPYGQLITYGAIAEKIAVKRGLKKVSARAVGSAVGRNPISIILPCHRVIGSDNSLTGYAGGIERKIYLLELEGADVSKLYVP